MVNETKRISANFGNISPASIESYISNRGYDALKKVLTLEPENVVQKVTDSGLRGRGGAGFPTGMKWKFTRASSEKEKYVICNADEGEPGTFKDRLIMENDPHAFIEGLIIAGYAIGASKGYIYIRGEYSQSIANVENALIQLRKKKILGENIYGSNFSFDIRIRRGAGSYLCGEELTLIESLEGKRGNPRIKPPFPAEKGAFGKPTLVNNVETLANIPFILNNEVSEFRSLGSEKSPGTKLFCVSGDVKNPGCFEVPLGTKLSEIIYDLAEGMKDHKEFKTALLGGAAGTFVPEQMLAINMDYDSLSAQGATLGSGAIIVMNKNRLISDRLASIINFFKHESCGKCVPCRVGCKQLQLLVNKKEKDKEVYDLMLAESEYMSRTSLCPLGQSPVLAIRSALKYFSNELYN